MLSRYEGRGSNYTALTESTALVDRLNINSARMVDIVLDIEEKFGVKIDDGAMPPTLKTVGDVVSFVDSLVTAQKIS